MCGIAGWFDPTGETRADAGAMLRLLKHRGPDSSGREELDGMTLLHTRLEVLDRTATGNQPAWSADRSVCVVFNGEIYNHHELRRDLEARGHRLVGRADTAVIAPLYLEYGDAFVERLRGMFAIGIYDTRRHRLVLHRDRFGIKPLYWARSGEGLTFASEIPPLRHVSGVDLRIDDQALHDYIALHHIPPPMTIHRGVRAMEPGTTIIAERHGQSCRVRTRRYHQWSADTVHIGDLERATDAIEPLLDRAVRRQLESDVPLGALLSGGIDSSLVCETANGALNGQLRTFGVSFPDPEFDERLAFESVAAQIGSDHTTLAFGSTPPTWQEVTDVLLATGQPFADSSIFGVDAISRLVRTNVTVALSGDGGDEAHAGYDFFARAYRLAALHRLPGRVRNLVGTTGLLSVRRAGQVIPVHAVERIVDVARCHSLADLACDQLSWSRQREQAELWVGPEVLPTARLFEAQWGLHGRTKSSVDRLFAHLTEASVRIRLAGDFLPKVDIASMRHSLEVRVPFLDEDLFAYGLSLPRELKRPRGQAGKRVLRQLAHRKVPTIADLPKWGFGVPFDTWVAERHGPMLQSMFADGAAIDEWIDPQISARLINCFVARSVPSRLTRQGLYQRIVMLLALELHLQHLRA